MPGFLFDWWEKGLDLEDVSGGIVIKPRRTAVAAQSPLKPMFNTNVLTKCTTYGTIS